MQYQILDWDTGFFGVTVARITEPALSEQELSAILLALKAKGTSLVYWPTGRALDGGVIKRLGGSLVDNKTTFAVDLRALAAETLAAVETVEPYAQSMPIQDIEDLAIQSGEYSRFAVDPNIPRERFTSLYRTWINRSLKKEIADEVLVIREGERVVGLVTLGNEDGRGDIGLIAVDGNHRGKGHGERLVRAAQRWFVSSGYELAQVVTQGMNIPACRLYERCGYSIEKVECFYHFWLNESV